MLQGVSNESPWGLVISSVVSNPEPSVVRPLICQLKSQAKDNYHVMCSILGAELTDIILTFRRSWKFKDLTGQKFNRLTVIRQAGFKKNLVVWLCKCECGNEKIVPTKLLNSKHTQSCGCLPTTYYKHAQSHTKLYKVWCSIKTRATDNPNQDERYKRKGISLCESWMDFQNFYDDMAATYKEGLTIERIDNNGNYEPSNCKWATFAEQSRNKETSLRFTINGITKVLKDWCLEYNRDYTTVRTRLKRGMNIVEALTKPPLPRYANGYKAA